jgi:hypothetical protein
MAARLTIYPPDQPVRSFMLDPGIEYQLGRSASCQIPIADPRISRTHARITRRDDAWRILDLGSKNGLQVGGQNCHEAELADGAWISIGGLLANFSLLSPAQLASDHRQAEARWGSTMDLSRRLEPAAGIERLLEQVLDAVLELADAQRGFVMLPDDQGLLAVRARVSRGTSDLASDPFPGSRSVVERALASRQSVVVCDAREDILLARRPSIESGAIRALVCLPLLIGEQLSGVIYLDSRVEGKVFTELDLEILETFGSHAALVLGVASVRDDLDELASLLPAEMARKPGADELVHRLQAALPAAASLPELEGSCA